MEKIRDYKDLMVWQKAHMMALDVYRITKQFPSEEKFGLVRQIRRSAASVPTNISEGFARYSKKEYIQFLYICRGSLSETDYHLQLSKDLDYISCEAHKNLTQAIVEIGKMINGLINALKQRC